MATKDKLVTLEDLDALKTYNDNEVDDLKSDLDGLSETLGFSKSNISIDSWGAYYVKSNGNISTSTNTATSIPVVVFSKERITIHVIDGYKIKLFEYSSTGRDSSSFVNGTDYYSGTFTISVDTEHYFRIQIAKEDMSQFTPSDLPVGVLTIDGDYEKTVYNYSLNLTEEDAYFKSDNYIDSSNRIIHTIMTGASSLFAISEGSIQITANDNFPTIYALLADDTGFYTTTSGSTPNFLNGYFGRFQLPAGETKVVGIPSDCVLYVYNKTQSGNVYFPSELNVLIDTDYELGRLGKPADSLAVAKRFEYIDSNNPTQTVFNYFKDDMSSYGNIDANGIEIVDSSNKVSDYYEIPLKYLRKLLYTHLVIDGSYGGKIAFYDSSKQYIETVDVNTYVTNNDAYSYARVVTPSSASDVVLLFSNENLFPQNKPNKTTRLGTDNWFGYSKNIVSDGCMTAMIKTALAYAKDERFGYGTEHTAFAEECVKTTKDTNTGSSNYDGERYQMDCSTYVMLIIQCIFPECSRYFHTKNIPSEYGFRFNELAEYEGYVYGVAQTMNTRRLYANSIAEYAHKNGCLYVVDDDYGNVKQGDILFVSNQNASYGFFENIGHCEFVQNVIPLENGGKAVETFEANGGASAPCQRHTYYTKQDRVIYGARLPYCFVPSTAKNIATFTDELTVEASGNAGDTVTLSTIRLSDSLLNGCTYTAVINSDYSEFGYFKTYVSGSVVDPHVDESSQKRPDGKAVMRFNILNTDTINNSDEIRIQFIFTDTASVNLRVKDFKLYDGYVTA